MIERNASWALLEHTVKAGHKRIDTWSRQIEELQEEIAKLNRWINFEQSDIDEANEMMNNIQEKEGSR